MIWFWKYSPLQRLDSNSQAALRIKFNLSVAISGIRGVRGAPSISDAGILVNYDEGYSRERIDFLVSTILLIDGHEVKE